ncbi:MAG: transcriptional regulator, TetR family protein [Microbacteriaceae bacterium]|jgi:AcrR family transcriptional regulator|nr:transcriptional regulator, TetR family protein [Microbacteriaceae bacterium]
MEETPSSARHSPRQDRSTQRVELILDTTAALIDEVGYGSITPTLIARRATMSGPAIYRYFDDLDAIVVALAKRNLERYLERSQLLLEAAADWQEAIAGSVAAYSEFYRDEPGFRWLRLGDPIAGNLLSASEGNKTLLARQVCELFVTRYEVDSRPDLLEHVEVMVEIADALIARAFESDPDGDRFFLDECTRVMVSYLGEYLAQPIP